MADIMEEISTLMDGEQTSAEEIDLIDNLRNNEELKQRWQRFHLLRDILQENKEEAQLKEMLHNIIHKNGQE